MADSEVTVEQLNAKVETLQKQLKANEDKEKMSEYEDEKKEARKAALTSAMAHMDATQKAAFRAAITASDDDDMKKAMDEMPHEKKDSKAKKGQEHEPKKEGQMDEEKKLAQEENEKLHAKVKKMEAKAAQPIVEKLLKAREIAGMPESTLQVLELQFKAKSLDEVEALYASEKSMIDALSTPPEDMQNIHIPFSASSRPGKLQSMNDIMNSGGIN